MSKADLAKRRFSYVLFSTPAHIVETVWAVFALAVIVPLGIGIITPSVELGIGVCAIAAFLAGASTSFVCNYDNVPHKGRIEERFLDGFWFGERTWASWFLYRHVLSSFGYRCPRSESDDIAELARRVMESEGIDDRLAEWNCVRVVRKMRESGFNACVEAYVKGVPMDDLAL